MVVVAKSVSQQFASAILCLTRSLLPATLANSCPAAKLPATIPASTGEIIKLFSSHPLLHSHGHRLHSNKVPFRPTASLTGAPNVRDAGGGAVRGPHSSPARELRDIGRGGHQRAAVLLPRARVQQPVGVHEAHPVLQVLHCRLGRRALSGGRGRGGRPRVCGGGPEGARTMDRVSCL